MFCTKFLSVNFHVFILFQILNRKYIYLNNLQFQFFKVYYKFLVFQNQSQGLNSQVYFETENRSPK